ncbi:hypothetical protein L1049_013212 [Liquidambar formosana]|uniref:Uncharacterized protein n=1 Tax=Liquidambar formosana TaxID=63359 RepID=A0AAP0WXQ7_LIQFO
MHYPRGLVLKLIYIIRQNSNPDMKNLSLILLGRIIRPVLYNIWPSLSGEVQAQLKDALLAFVQNREEDWDYKEICQMIAALALEIYALHDEWPQLISFLVNSVKSVSWGLQERSLLIFSFFSHKCHLTRCVRLVSHLHSPVKLFCVEVLTEPSVVIGHPDPIPADDVDAYKAAVSALGKICAFHWDNIDAVQVVTTWMSLPRRYNLIKVRAVHEQLCNLFQMSNVLLDLNGQNLPRVIAICAEAQAADVIGFCTQFGPSLELVHTSVAEAEIFIFRT